MTKTILELNINLEFVIKEGVILIEKYLDDEYFEQLKIEYTYWYVIRDIINELRKDPCRNNESSIQDLVKKAMENYVIMESHCEFVIHRLHNIVIKNILKHEDEVCQLREGIALLQLIREYIDFISTNTTTTTFVEKNNRTFLDIKLKV